MAAANIFGVSASTIQALVADFTISSTSSPSLDDISDTIIPMEADSVRGRADKSLGVGVSDSLTSDDSGYGILKRILAFNVVATVVSSRGRGEIAADYIRRIELDWARLEDKPQTVVPTHVSTSAETTDQWAERTGAVSGQDAFNQTAGGRIITGNSL